MNLKSLLITLFISALMSCLAVLIYQKFYGSKTAYVDIKKVFNGFQMKTEMEAKYNQVKKGRDKILDSLSFNLKIMSKHLNEQKNAKADIKKEEMYQFEYDREEFIKLKRQFEEDNTALSQKLDTQILSQLTQYVIEYGKKNNYALILGADGNGGLMYARESYDISDEIVAFINSKYKGID